MSTPELLSPTKQVQYEKGKNQAEKISKEQTPRRLEIVQVRLDEEITSGIEQHLFAKFKSKKKQKEKENEEISKQRKLAMDILAEEWFSTDKASAEARVYLVEKLLPALIVGLEKVLMEAEKRNVINPGSDSNAEVIFGNVFNPINLLAQQLMRNNPKFSNFPEASPYARGLRAISDKIKQQVFDSKNNKLLELKEQVEEQRKKLEEEERQRNAEKNRRRRLMENQFQMWLLGNSKQVPMLLVQNGLFSYLEISSHFASDSEDIVKFDEYLERNDDADVVMDKNEFMKFLNRYIKSFTPEKFQDVIDHLNQCALAYRKTYEQDMWNSMFLKLFESLDSEGIGYLDRHRVIHLFEKFWDQDSKRGKELNNPRKWPVIELEELDDLFSNSYTDDENMTVRVSNTSSENGDYDSTSKEESTTVTVKTEDTTEEQPVTETQVSETAVSADEDAKVTVEEQSTDDKPSAEEVEKPNEEAPDLPLSNETATAAEEKSEDKNEEKVNEDADTNKATEESEKVQEENVQEETTSDSKELENEDGETNEGKQEAEAKESDESTEQAPPAEESDDVTEKAAEVDEETENKTEGQESTSATADEEVAATDQKPAATDNEEALKSPITKGLVLTTPVLTDDGDSSTAVKIQFSKSTPQERQVRKTTTYSTVSKGRFPEPARPGGNDIPFEIGTPIRAPDYEEAESEDQSHEQEDSSGKKSPISGIIKTVDNSDEASMSVHGKTRASSTYQMSVAFAADPVTLTEKGAQEFYSEFSSRSHSRMSVFDESQLNKPRFVSLMEAFVRDEATHKIVEDLLNFIFYGYVETQEEKMDRIAKAHRAALSAKHRDMIENVFNKWDIDGRGYLEIDVIEEILSKYKGGSEAAALKRGRIAIRKSRKQRINDTKVTRKEFHTYIHAVIDAIAGGEEVFDSVIEYVTTTVERTYAESVRGEARQKWLRQIQDAAETSGALMAPVYRFIFQTLSKDAEAHGNQKRISAYVALLENNLSHPSRGNFLLRYAGWTNDNERFLKGKAFYEDMPGISFYCVKRGKMVHVPRVHSHGRIYFWNEERLEEPKEASLVLLPLKDEDHRVFGLLGIDNLGDIGDRSVFSTHELNFYQGVAKAFHTAFHLVDLKRKLLCIIESAMSWIHSRAPTILNITIYFVEPDLKNSSNFVLRKMMFANNTTGVTQRYSRPQRLHRKDNLFRDYLFKCMETSDTVTSEAYGEYHMAYPIRGDKGDCQCVVDVSLGKHNKLPKYEAMEMQRMLKLLQAANKEMLHESSSGKKNIVLEAESRISDDTRVEIMFDRLMLTDLRENVKKLDKSVFAELHNYKIPPIMIHNIVKAVLMLFYQDDEEHEALEDWVKCKQLTTAKLHQKIVDFDPTAKEAVTDEVVGKMSRLLKGIAHGAVAKHGSMPAQQLYNWAFVCLSLIEHTRKSGDNSSQPAITPVTSASTVTTTNTEESQKAASSEGAL